MHTANSQKGKDAIEEEGREWEPKTQGQNSAHGKEMNSDSRRCQLSTSVFKALKKISTLHLFCASGKRKLIPAQDTHRHSEQQAALFLFIIQFEDAEQLPQTLLRFILIPRNSLPAPTSREMLFVKLNGAGSSENIHRKQCKHLQAAELAMDYTPDVCIEEDNKKSQSLLPAPTVEKNYDKDAPKIALEIECPVQRCWEMRYSETSSMKDRYNKWTPVISGPGPFFEIKHSGREEGSRKGSCISNSNRPSQKKQVVKLKRCSKDGAELLAKHRGAFESTAGSDVG
ncbi:hypothetical protein ACRRTK_010288 [Alexandromys fortis]